MELCIEKIGIIRLQRNPKNQEVNLNLDWSVDFKKTTPQNIIHVCNIKSSLSIHLSLRLEGLIILEQLEVFSEGEVSQIIFDRGFEILLNLFNLSKEYFFELNQKMLLMKVKL